jgi:FkbM family methyltransferase
VFRQLMSKVRRDGLGAAMRAAHHKAQMWYNSPKITISSTSLTLKTLGSRYGSWTFFNAPPLPGARIICCGAGEDISFDVEMANELGCEVTIVDPTPRAVAHVNDVLARIGQPFESQYEAGGRQSAASYDLHKIVPGQIDLLEKALWIEPGVVRFFEPNNSSHVSHSIVNIQNKQDQDQSNGYIELPTLTLSDIFSDYQIDTGELLKLDIEGAEISVLHDLAKGDIRPKQVLVEFDGLNLYLAQNNG